jgi:modification methylase
MDKNGLTVDQVIHGDCLQVLNSLPERSIDLIFADPPYNLQLSQELHRPNQSRVDGVDDAWDKFSSFAEYDNFTRAWLSACRRVLKDTGAIWVIGSYHNIYRVGAILMDLDYWILNDVVWVKTNPMPNFRGVRFTNAHETLLWAQKVKGEKYTFNHHAMKSLNGDLQMRSDWEIPLCTGPERVKVNGQKAHSTQKPEALLYRVILSSSNTGDLVLDPFFGSGTTGAVAKKLHRHWIGIERDPAYVQVAQERIQAVEPDSADLELYQTRNRRNRPRVSVGALVEKGYLQIGQTLFFGSDGDLRAAVMANGALRLDGISGSIHKLAEQILQAPCNGWEHWYYLDADTGKKIVIDSLREKYIKEAATSQSQ